jgi:hypothetical protein
MMLRELERIGHPPYSPYLALRNFFLFRYLKRRLTERQWDTPENLFAEVRDIIQGISRTFVRRYSKHGKCGCMNVGVPVGNIWNEFYNLVLLSFIFSHPIGANLSQY